MHLWTNYILTRSNADDDDDAIDAIRPVTVQRNYPSDRVFFLFPDERASSIEFFALILEHTRPRCSPYISRSVFFRV